jgi:hypothetical protein
MTTFLATGVDSSRLLWELRPDASPAAVARHDLVDSVVREYGASRSVPTDDGADVLAQFCSSAHAATAALAIQQALSATHARKRTLPRRSSSPLRCRMSTGDDSDCRCLPGRSPSPYRECPAAVAPSERQAYRSARIYARLDYPCVDPWGRLRWRGHADSIGRADNAPAGRSPLPSVSGQRCLQPAPRRRPELSRLQRGRRGPHAPICFGFGAQPRVHVADWCIRE